MSPTDHQRAAEIWLARAKGMLDINGQPSIELAQNSEGDAALVFATIASVHAALSHPSCEIAQSNQKGTTEA